MVSRHCIPWVPTHKYVKLIKGPTIYTIISCSLLSTSKETRGNILLRGTNAQNLEVNTCWMSGTSEARYLPRRQHSDLLSASLGPRPFRWPLPPEVLAQLRNMSLRKPSQVWIPASALTRWMVLDKSLNFTVLNFSFCRRKILNVLPHQVVSGTKPTV